MIFEGWSWFKFNNLRLALGMALKFYTSVTKGLKLRKVRNFGRLTPTFAEVTGKKLVGGRLFAPSLFWIGLVNNSVFCFEKTVTMVLYTQTFWLVFIMVTMMMMIMMMINHEIPVAKYMRKFWSRNHGYLICFWLIYSM